MAVRILIHNGSLVLLDPLPEEWYEGAEVKLLTWEPVPQPTPEEMERAWRELDDFGLDEEEFKRLQQAIDEIRHLHKPRLPNERGE